MAKSGREQASERAPARLFYGWVVVGATFVVLFMGFGIAYSFGAFFSSLQAEFAANRGQISLIFSISGFLYFGLGAASGALADRVGARPVVLAGMLVMGAGLVLASQAQALWQVYATYSLSVGIGVGLAYVPAIGAVQHWFARRRGLASGFAVAGIGVGTLAMPPLAAWLIDWSDWRGAYLALAIAAVVVGIAAALLIEDSPKGRGLLPDGDTARTEPAVSGEATEGAAPGGHGDGASLRQALRSRSFWVLYAAASATAFAVFVPFVHLTAYARDHGLPERTGVMLLGFIGLGSVIGRFILGAVADRLGRKVSLAVTFAGMGAMMLWWLASTSAWALAVFAVVFGVFYGGFVALAPALITDYFGERNVSGIIGLLYTSVAFGTLLGPTLAGVAYDLSGSYTLPIAAGVGVNLIAVCCIALLGEPTPWRQRA